RGRGRGGGGDGRGGGRGFCRGGGRRRGRLRDQRGGRHDGGRGGWQDGRRFFRRRARLVRKRRDARRGLVRLHVIEHEIAGDADRDGIAKGGHLADRETRDLPEEPVH